MDLAVWEGHEVVALKEVENALAEKIHHNADVVSEIEAVSEVNTSVPVLFVVGLQCCQDPKLDLAGVPILLN